MSETVMFTGKLKKYEFPKEIGDTLKEKTDYLIIKGFSFEHSEIEDKYIDEGDGFIVVDGDFYEILEKESQDDDDIFKAKKNDDGTINFTVKYYDGGCSFTEAIEDAIENMNKESK